VTALRKALAATAMAVPVLATAAGPALAGTSPNAGAPAKPDVPCCGGAGQTDTWANNATNNYLHVKGGSKANSAVINTYTGTGTCARQHGAKNLQCAEEWSQISTAYAHQFVYANVNSGKCLDDGENKIGIVPSQYSCGTYPPNMRWIHATFDYWNGFTNITYYNALYTAYGTEDRVLCAYSTGASPNSLFIDDPSGNYAPGGDGYCDWQ
jgi:hypothetical protein